MPINAAMADTIISVAVGPSLRGGLLCLAAGLTGLYRSSGVHQPWQPVASAVPGTGAAPAAVSAVAIARAAGGEGARPVIFAGATGVVWRSLDEGDSWTASALPLPAPAITALAVSPSFARDGVLFAGAAEDGVLCSNDGGATWESWNFGLYDRHVFSLAVSPDYATDGTLLAGTQTGLFQSGNGGRSWQRRPFPGEAAPILSLAAAPSPGGDRLLCAGTESAGVFVSADRGETWSYAGSAGQSINAVGIFPGMTGGYDILAAAEDGLLISHDRGQTWLGWGAPVEGILCLAAPDSLKDGAPVLVGLAERGVLWLTPQGGLVPR